MKQGIGNNRIFFFLIMILIASPTFLLYGPWMWIYRKSFTMIGLQTS